MIADLKKLYYQCGVENKPTVFLFTDTQVAEETFLEDINNILSSGEVPNLYKAEELEEVCFLKMAMMTVMMVMVVVSFENLVNTLMVVVSFENIVNTVMVVMMVVLKTL